MHQSLSAFQITLKPRYRALDFGDSALRQAPQLILAYRGFAGDFP